MSRSSSHKSPEGYMQNHQQKKLQGNGHGVPRKGSKTSTKSNDPKETTARHAGTVLSNIDGQDENDEGNSSATEGRNDSSQEQDVSALSGARDIGNATQLLTGLQSVDDDMFQETDGSQNLQAVAGAELELAESDYDNDYADVEDVSDSDESESDANENSILRSAENDLINEFERNEGRLNTNLMLNDMNDMALNDEALAIELSLQSADSQTAGRNFEIDMNDDPFFGLAQQEHLYQDMLREAESKVWRMPDTVRTREASDPSSTTQKRVRFEETEFKSPSLSGSDDANEAFPDLFADADDPLVKQQIALGAEADLGMLQHDFADADSFYDFEDEDEKLAFEVDEESDSDDDRSSYDSDDEGDATDEESREEQIARMEEYKRTTNSATSTPILPKREISIAGSIVSTPVAHKRDVSMAGSTASTPRPATPKTGKGLKFGTFAIDPTRPTITSDVEGRKIKVLPPSRPLEQDKAFWERARSANRSRNGSASDAYLTMPSPRVKSLPERPFTARSTLGSMFNGDLDILRNNDVAGIADDLFPTMMAPQASSITTATTDDSDTDLQDINMQDFIDMDDSDSSDSDRPQTASVTSPDETDIFTSMVSNSSHNGRRGSDLLDHFDHHRGVIGSFRHNQHHVKRISSLPSHPAKRASAHEYNALQKGRRGAANTPMTPARKKRASQDLTSSGAGVRKSVNSPLSARRPRSRGNSIAGISNADLFQTFTRSPFE